jgi:chromosome partitioning protein
MRVLAVANQKGGVGKTTTAVTLGGVLAHRGLRVLLVDTDPHGSLTAYFRLDPDGVEHSVYELFVKPGGGPVPVARMVRPAGHERLHLLPASTAMATLDRQLAGRDGMGLVLARALEGFRDRYDYVIIDCPPIMGVLMVNALAAAEFLLIPVQTEFLALKGLERMVRTLGMIAKARKNPLEFLVVPTLYDKRTRASRDALTALRSRYGRFLWPGVVPVDTQFREASKAGVPLNLMLPACRGARAYQKLCDRVVERLAPSEPLRSSA